MTKSFSKSNLNRRQFLKHSGKLAAGAAVLGSLQRSVFAGENNTIRLALLGCGGRGTGAVGDALSVKNSGPVKLYATVDHGAEEKVSRQNRRYRGPQVPRFRRLQKGHRYSKARGRRHVHNPLLYPAAARRVCH